MIAIEAFAGFGGFTEGAERAGARVVWAANHWRTAVDVHAANHPSTEHACQDVAQADWSALPQHDLFIAAPECPGHSAAAQPARARSAIVRSNHASRRSTAWAVIDAAEVCRPRAIVVENVPEFRRWTLFPLWIEALDRLGYTTDLRVLRASRFGVPQRRDRVFVVAMLGGRFPAPIIEAADEPPIGPCIDWSAPGWRTLAEMKPGARARMERARRRCGDRFVGQHVTSTRGIRLSEPLNTITTQDHYVVVDGDRYRPFTDREYARGMGFPESYVWPGVGRGDAIVGLGNAVPPALGCAVLTATMEAM